MLEESGKRYCRVLLAKVYGCLDLIKSIRQYTFLAPFSSSPALEGSPERLSPEADLARLVADFAGELLKCLPEGV
jgi:hypothetical protein